MNIDIRSHIINNFKNDNKTTLEEVINESIKEKDDVTLPGLGVFFELVWNKADSNLKEEILNILEDSINN